MRRREFLTLLTGGAAGWPLAGRAQTTPVIGFLNNGSQATGTWIVDAFRQGLNDEGYVEGHHVAIEYRWAEGQYQRLEEHAADLVRRQVALIAATGGVQSARVAKAATATIPILFISGVDPVRAKLVASINRPGGNATGVSVITSEMVAKRLQLLRELAPHASTVAMLQNIKSYPTEFDQNFVTEVELKEATDAASAVGLRSLVIDAARDSDLQAALDTAVTNGADALFVSADPFFTDRRDQIVALAARHKLPAVYPWRQYAEAGGLMSYGPNISDVCRQIGRYAGRILKGAKPAELPVQMPMNFELVINLKTAKALGLDIPPLLLVRVTQAIE
jgi:putative tryptophan/tyrosine transport system substrate-binding protein